MSAVHLESAGMDKTESYTTFRSIFKLDDNTIVLLLTIKANIQMTYYGLILQS